MLNTREIVLEEVACESLKTFIFVSTIATLFRPLDMAMNYAHLTEGGFKQVMKHAATTLLKSPTPVASFASGTINLAVMYKLGLYRTLKGAALKNFILFQTPRCESAVMAHHQSGSTEKAKTSELLKAKATVAAGLGCAETVLTHRITLMKVTQDASIILGTQTPKPTKLLEEVKFTSVGFGANLLKKSLTILPYTLLPLLKEHLEDEQGMNPAVAGLISAAVIGAGATPVINFFDTIQKHQMTTITHQFESKSMFKAAKALGAKGLVRGVGVSTVYGIAGLQIVSIAQRLANSSEAVTTSFMGLFGTSAASSSATEQTSKDNYMKQFGISA